MKNLFLRIMEPDNAEVHKLKFVKCGFYVFKVFGLSKINTTGSTGRKNENDVYFTHSKKDLIYNVFMIALVLTFSYCNIYHLSVLLKNSQISNYQFYVSLVRYEFAAAISIIILLRFCIKQKNFNSLIDNILSLRGFLIAFNEKMYSDESFLLLRKIIYFCLINIVPFIGYIAFNEIFFYTGVLNLVAKCFCEIIINYGFVQYIIVLMFIKHFFKVTNKNFSLVFVESSKTEQEKFVDFSRLHDHYFLLCELPEKVSKFYNFSLFFSMVYI